jgi:hypothetical protein
VFDVLNHALGNTLNIDEEIIVERTSKPKKIVTRTPRRAKR